MSTEYTLNFSNESTMQGDICVFQNDPDIGVQNVMSLAWFTKGTNPGTDVSFHWSIDYSFVWDETGVLKPGVTFKASEVKPADLKTKNMIDYSKNKFGYEFENQTTGKPTGSLIINEKGTVPAQQSSVGIGMSGQGVYAVQAEPNIHVEFTPHPVYWLAFGTYASGQVLDIEQITDAVALKFPPNVYSMNALINKQNEIIVSEGGKKAAA